MTGDDESSAHYREAAEQAAEADHREAEAREQTGEAFYDIEAALADACHAGGLSTPRYRNASRMLAALRAERERFARVVEAARHMRRRYSYAHDGDVTVSGLLSLWSAVDALDGGDQ